jgi:hypothetical protein
MEWSEVSPIVSAVLQVVLVAVLSIVAQYVTRWLKAKSAEALSAAKDYQPSILAMVESIASVAVKAAEQAGAAGLIEDKKRYAMGVASKWLDDQGIIIDLSLISAAVEAAVLSELHGGKEVKALPAPKK